MALVSNIVIDLASGTIILTATVSGVSVETITYTQSNNQVTFDARDDVIIQFSEFLPLCEQITILETAILFNYPSINVFATTPFTQMQVNELHDVGMWNLTVTSVSNPNIVEYQGTKSSTKLEMLERADNKTLSFPEWLKFLIALNHYKLSIKGF